MEGHFVWMTTRRIKPGTLTEFERAWRPETHPEGMLHAYAYWSEDGRQIIGVPLWASKESCDAWRGSEAEARRRAAMASYVLRASRPGLPGTVGRARTPRRVLRGRRASRPRTSHQAVRVPAH